VTDWRRRTRLIAALLGGLVAATLAWGFWRASSRGTLHVALYDVGVASERRAYGTVLDAEVSFHDAAGRTLAAARAHAPLGVVSVIHPEVGDCRQEERRGGAAWQACFETQSRWLVTWVRDVRAATVSTGACTIGRVPVQLRESRNEWWLWWVPHPHIGGTPYTSFALTLWIDSSTCRPANPPAR
jgi:hypothetical protein